MNCLRPVVLWLTLSALATAGSHAAASDCGLSRADHQRLSELAQSLAGRGHAPGTVLDMRCQGRP